MTDDRLRAAERRWRETGSLEDRAALLFARVRSGSLTVSRLRAAEVLGDEGAELALARVEERAPKRPTVMTRMHVLGVFARQVSRELPEASARALLALLLVAEELEVATTAEAETVLRLQDALACSCDASLSTTLIPWYVRWTRAAVARAALAASDGAGGVHGVVRLRDKELDVVVSSLSARITMAAHDRPLDPELARALRVRRRLRASEFGNETIAAELLPWVLRERDPVGERFLTFRGACMACGRDWTEEPSRPWEERL